MPDGALHVDVAALRDLAARASTLSGDIGALGASMPELDAASSGSVAVSSALAAFGSAVLERTTALQGELEDAAEFLHTFADTMQGADDRAAGGGT